MLGSDELERAIDELYADEPERFTEARDALAKRLKADGDDHASRRVRALRKPVRSAWAVNRFVREDRPAVEALIQSGERLRAAQQRALSGSGADELRERSDERRQLVTRLTQRAAAFVGDGEPPAAAVEDISATFEAASIDEESAKVVLEGRLTKPLARPAGFGDVFGLRPVEGRRATTRTEPTPAEDRAERRRRERELRAAEERERTARGNVERLRARLEELQGELSAVRDELRAAEAEARGAAVDVRRLRR